MYVTKHGEYIRRHGLQLEGKRIFVRIRQEVDEGVPLYEQVKAVVPTPEAQMGKKGPSSSKEVRMVFEGGSKEHRSITPATRLHRAVRPPVGGGRRIGQSLVTSAATTVGPAALLAQGEWFDVPAVHADLWRLQTAITLDPEIAGLAGQQGEIVVVVVSGQDAAAGLGIAQGEFTISAGAEPALVNLPSTTSPLGPRLRGVCRSRGRREVVQLL